MIRVLLFAHLRTVCGVTEISVSPGDAHTGDALWAHLVARHPALVDIGPSVRLAVNGAFVPITSSLKSGDEVAFIPPVSGG